MRLIVSILLGTILTLLQGCIAVGPNFHREPIIKKDTGNLYIYRPNVFEASGMSPKMSLNGVLLGKLMNGGYLLKSASPGNHILSVDLGYDDLGNSIKPIQMPIRVQGGEETFVRLKVGISKANLRYVTFGWRLEQMSSDTALNEIQETKQLSIENNP